METDRRDFLEKMLLAAAGALTLPGALTGCGDSVAPSDRARLGLIGMGGYGTKLVDAFGAVRGCDIAAVCDADTDHGKAGAWFALGVFCRRA